MGRAQGKILRTGYISAKKEAQETKHWLRILAIGSDSKEDIREAWKEAQELTQIFQKKMLQRRGEKFEFFPFESSIENCKLIIENWPKWCPFCTKIVNNPTTVAFQSIRKSFNLRPIEQGSTLSTQGPTLLTKPMYTKRMAAGVKLGFGELAGTRRAKKGGTAPDFEAKKYLLLGNVGLQGSIIFSSKEDYDRFEAYLYLLNAIEGPRASNYFLEGRSSDIFSAALGDRLVAIGAYSFTPKRFYILATPLSPNGIAKFMQKLQTAYTMYFNLKYQRDGRIFHGAYTSEAAQSEKHLKYLFATTHLHPAILFDAEWESANEIDLRALAYKASEYRYSSVGEYARKKFVITAPEHFPKYFYAAKNPDALIRMWREGKRAAKK